MKYRLTCNLCGKVVYETQSPSMVATWGELADHDWVVAPQVNWIALSWALHLRLDHPDHRKIDTTKFKGEIVEEPITGSSLLDGQQG